MLPPTTGNMAGRGPNFESKRIPIPTVHGRHGPRQKLLTWRVPSATNAAFSFYRSCPRLHRRYWQFKGGHLTKAVLLPMRQNRLLASAAHFLTQPHFTTRSGSLSTRVKRPCARSCRAMTNKRNFSRPRFHPLKSGGCCAVAHEPSTTMVRFACATFCEDCNPSRCESQNPPTT